MDEGYIYFTLALLAHSHSPPHKPYNYCRGVCAGVGMLFVYGTIVSPVVCVFVCVCAVLVCGVFCVSVGSAKMNLLDSNPLSVYGTVGDRSGDNIGLVWWTYEQAMSP